MELTPLVTSFLSLHIRSGHSGLSRCCSGFLRFHLRLVNLLRYHMPREVAIPTKHTTLHAVLTPDYTHTPGSTLPATVSTPPATHIASHCYCHTLSFASSSSLPVETHTCRSSLVSSHVSQRLLQSDLSLLWLRFRPHAFQESSRVLLSSLWPVTLTVTVSAVPCQRAGGEGPPGRSCVSLTGHPEFQLAS